MESLVFVLAHSLHQETLTIGPAWTSTTMLMLTPITITIALLCCAFVVALAYVAIDEQA